MKILYVINNAFTKGNGLTASCRRIVQGLREAGEEVRIISGAVGDEQPYYLLKDYRVPVFWPIIEKQGYSFATTDNSIVGEAVRWADVIHLEEPFTLEMRVCKIAKKENKPVTATYHLHPENFFASFHLQRSLVFNGLTMLIWRNHVFNRCRMIQCPTENVRRRLERWNFKSELRVISNGVVAGEPVPEPVSVAPDGFFTVVTTGRFSVEKDQITLLKAMEYSKYAGRIQLVFAGRGPTGGKLKKKADALLKKGILKTPPVFGFYSMDELRSIYAAADLYVHCAYVEVEGMSCMEAVQTGLVPVIADGKFTATSQFAMDERSVFGKRNAKELAERIDYWLSDDARREAEAARYAESMKKYDIGGTVASLLEMYRDAVAGARGEDRGAGSDAE